MNTSDEIIATIAFKSRDKKAFDEFWSEVRTRYKFCDRGGDAPTMAFAVHMGNMFAADEALTEILDSDLSDDEKLEAISDLNGHESPADVLRKWEITPFAERVSKEQPA